MVGSGLVLLQLLLVLALAVLSQLWTEGLSVSANTPDDKNVLC